MRIAVCVKEVLDTRLPLQVMQGKMLQASGIPVTVINPADRSALEVALEVKEANAPSDVTAFGVCGADQEKALRFALARGADSAERLEITEQVVGPPLTALALAERFSGGEFRLIFCGEQTLDNASAMVGPLIAELLDFPHVSSVCRLRESNPGKLIVERLLDRGHRQVVEVQIPAVITLAPNAVEPKYVSVSRLQCASAMPILVHKISLDLADSRLPWWPAVENRLPPRARVKRKFIPDPNLSAADRIKLIMAGGLSAASESQNTSIIEGDSDYISKQLFRFLKHNKLI